MDKTRFDTNLPSNKELTVVTDFILQAIALAESIPKVPKFKEITSPSGLSSINQHITPVKASKGVISYAMLTPSNEDLLSPPSLPNPQ